MNINKLKDLILKFELYFNECQNDIDDKTNELQTQGKFKEASAHSFIVDTINRNVNSIKKQIKKL